MANCVPVGPISYTVPTAPAAGAAAASVVIVTLSGSAPAGMLTARLPSEELTAPPEGPTIFMVGIPAPGFWVGPLPQPTAASVNEQRIDVWSERARIARNHRCLRRRIERELTERIATHAHRQNRP